MRHLIRAIATALLCSVATVSWSGTQIIKMQSVGASGPIQVNVDYFEPGIGIVCTVSSGGSVTYSVQVTGDPIPPISGITHWNDHDIIANKSASINDSIVYPVTAVRVNVTAYSSGDVTCAFVQANSTFNVAPYQKGEPNK